MIEWWGDTYINLCSCSLLIIVRLTFWKLPILYGSLLQLFALILFDNIRTGNTVCSFVWNGSGVTWSGIDSTVCPRKMQHLIKWHFYLCYFIHSNVLTIRGCWPIIYLLSIKSRSNSSHRKYIYFIYGINNEPCRVLC